jgi:uncharacterized membrane protein SpoIIM required for sporulation
VDLSTVNKHSPWSLAISAIFFSCFGGMKLGWGIQQFAAARFQYSWIESFLTGSAFLGVGIFWVVLLVRRATPDTGRGGEAA